MEYTLPNCFEFFEFAEMVKLQCFEIEFDEKLHFFEKQTFQLSLDQ